MQYVAFVAVAVRRKTRVFNIYSGIAPPRRTDAGFRHLPTAHGWASGNYNQRVWYDNATQVVAAVRHFDGGGQLVPDVFESL